MHAYCILKGGEKMEMIPVESSNLESVGYEDGMLYITFQSSGTYVYYSVPVTVYEGLMNAPSKGKYFYNCIRDKYQYRKI